MTQNCVAFMRFLTPGDCRGSSCGEICLWNAAVPRIGNANLGVEPRRSSIEAQRAPSGVRRALRERERERERQGQGDSAS